MKLSPKNPWYHAGLERREYITPEDIGDAIKAGAGHLDIARVTLKAINDRAAEDYRLCAFVAIDSSEWKARERRLARKRRASQRQGPSK